MQFNIENTNIMDGAGLVTSADYCDRIWLSEMIFALLPPKDSETIRQNGNLDDVPLNRLQEIYTVLKEHRQMEVETPVVATPKRPEFKKRPGVKPMPVAQALRAE